MFKFKIGRAYSDFQFETTIGEIGNLFKYFLFVPDQFVKNKLNVIECAMDVKRMTVFRNGGLGV